MLSPYIFEGIWLLMFNTTLEGNKFGFAIPLEQVLKI